MVMAADGVGLAAQRLQVLCGLRVAVDSIDSDGRHAPIIGDEPYHIRLAIWHRARALVWVEHDGRRRGGAHLRNNPDWPLWNPWHVARCGNAESARCRNCVAVVARTASACRPDA